MKGIRQQKESNYGGQGQGQDEGSRRCHHRRRGPEGRRPSTAEEGCSQRASRAEGEDKAGPAGSQRSGNGARQARTQGQRVARRGGRHLVGTLGKRRLVVVVGEENPISIARTVVNDCLRGL